jgi:cystathionine beta-lyase/cystathionine gamma-synthase
MPPVEFEINAKRSASLSSDVATKPATTSLCTLGLRMEQINRSVIEIIKMLQAHPAVQQVFHPSITFHCT